METNTKTLSNIVIEQEKEIKELRMQLNTIIIAASSGKCLSCLLKFIKIKNN
jgi:hypothetical protein